MSSMENTGITVDKSMRPKTLERACQTCKVAKSKCIPRPGSTSGACQRCYRLKKHCMIQPPSIRKPRAARRNHVAQLEKKLDGLVSLLQSEKSTKLHPSEEEPLMKSPITPASTASVNEGYPYQRSSDLGHEVQQSERLGEAPPSIVDTTVSYLLAKTQQKEATTRLLQSSGNPGLEPDDVEADQLIKMYQEEMTNQTPFVVVPHDMTASELRDKKPLLFKAVMMATSYEYPSRQTFYEKQIVEHITEQVLLGGKKSLELLQGVLLLIAWYKRACVQHPKLNTFLQLAVALVADLGLNRGPNWYEKSKLAMASNNVKGVHFGAKTMGERRAALGCFYVTSTISTTFQRLDAMRYSPHLQESCRILVETAEYPGDIQLAYMVKIQHIIEKIGRVVHGNDWDDNSTPKAPVSLHVKAFQSELISFMDCLPPSLKQNTTILMHLDFASIRLYEISLADPPSTSSALSVSDSGCLDNLYTLLLSTKSYIQRILYKCQTTHLSLSFLQWAQFAYTLMILKRLTFFSSPSCPSWTIPFVRSVLDFGSVLDSFAAPFEQAKAGLEATMWRDETLVKLEKVDLYEMYARKIRMIQGWFASKVAHGSSSHWDWAAEKAKLRATFENKKRQREGQRKFGHESRDVETEALGMEGNDMQMLDPGAFTGLEEDAFWTNFTEQWGDGPLSMELYSSIYAE